MGLTGKLEPQKSNLTSNKNGENLDSTFESDARYLQPRSAEKYMNWGPDRIEGNSGHSKH